jgi:hypothetical protein
MKQYEVKVDLRKNGTYTDGTKFPVTFIISAGNLKSAKDFAWEVFVTETKSIMRREMCKVDVNRI